MKAFLAAFRKAVLPGIWAQGTKLSREPVVFLEREAPDELVLRVRDPAMSSVPTVNLYLESHEWACNCGGAVDPCVHIAAAVNAAQSAAQKGESLPRIARPAGHLRYRLARTKVSLRPESIHRAVVFPDGREESLTGTLTASVSRDDPDASFTPTQSDFRVDRALDLWAHGGDAVRSLAEVLSALADCPDIQLDGQPVTASDEPIVPRAIVDDHEKSKGFVLRIVREPALTDVIAPGVGLVGNTVRPLGETSLAGASSEKLPLVRVFPRERVVDLVCDALPDLEKRVPVEVRTKTLPSIARGIPPRIEFQLVHGPRSLAVTPSVVYGDPPHARVTQSTLAYVAGAVPVRDVPAERELIARLRDELNLVPERSVRFEGDEAVRCASRLRQWYAKSPTGQSLDLWDEARALVPRVEMSDDGTQFDVVFETASSDGASTAASGKGPDDPDDGGLHSPNRARAADVLRAWNEGLGLVGLEHGGFAPLPEAWLREHGHRVAELLAARENDGTLPRAVLPALAQFCDAIEHPRPVNFGGLEALLTGFDSIPRAVLPADLTASLRPYQHAGVSWLSFLRDAGLGAVLADDMGLGKTLQTLCALRGRALVVCPRSVVHNWAAEIRRFRPSLTHSLYHGAQRTMDPSADVTLTTYAILRLDAAKLAAEAWDVIVLDEAQQIKNPDSQVARAAYGLRGKFRVALSGTPVENKLEEIWSLLHFTNPGLLGGLGNFQERYAVPVAQGDAEALDRLRARIRPFVLRRLKREVAPELPPRTEGVLYCELEPAERDVYETVRAATRKEVLADLSKGGNVLAALEALLRLRQAACHPQLVPGNYADSSSKVERLLEALFEATEDGHKSVVFSQWTTFLDLVEPHLKTANTVFLRLDGSTRDRQSVVEKFQSDPGVSVLLVSLKAGGTGLNLTAADHVFLLDPWWNPAAEDQAADRAHRIGQTRPVFVYRMVSRATVEEGILALQQRKRALADATLDGADHSRAITREELLALLD